MAPPRSSCTPTLWRALAVGSLFLGLAASASAQGTDSCTSPTVVAGFGSFAINNTGAATGQDFAAGCATMGRDVWFTWNSPVSGSVTVATCGGVTFDSVIGVYNGNTCPGAASIACNDDSCSLQSSATFTAVSGQDYVFQIGGFSNASGSGTFTVSGPPVPPANDDCSAATPIAGTGLFPFTTINATTGTEGQAEAACNFFSFTAIARDVWFNWTAPSTGIATVETCAQAAYDTKLAAYSGAGCPVGATIACNDDACALQSRIQFACVAGQVYSIQVGSYPGGGGSSGAGNLNITVGAPTLKLSQLYGAGGNVSSPLRRDYIEIYNPGPVAVPLSGWSVQYASAAGTFTLANSTALPAVTLGVGRYLLVEESTGGTLAIGQVPDLPTPEISATVAMAADSFKVALVSSTTALPTGTPTYAGNPTLVDFVGTGTANWNDASANGAAHVAANNAPPGSTALALHRLNCGAGDTNVSKDDWAQAFPAPRNSAAAVNAGVTAIGTALPLTPREGDTVRLTVTPYTCLTGAPLSGATVSVNTTAIGGGPTAMLDNGTGGDEVANDGIYTALVTVGAGTGGLSYSLPVSVTSGPNSGATYISIFVTLPATPANDNCSTADPLVGAFPIVTLGNLTGATVESNPLVTAASAPTTGMTSRRGLWYSVTGTGNTMTADLCATAPSFDSVMIVFAGTCDGLTVIATGDDNGPACTGTQASAAWCSQAGATYLIWVAPFGTAASTASFTLTVNDGAPCVTALPVTICTGTAGPFTESEAGYGIATNDGCSSSPNRFTDIPMPGASPTLIRGTARGMIGNRDVDWYRFQATASGPIQITIDTLGSQAQAQLHSLGVGGVCPSTLIVSTPLFVARCATGIQTVSSNVTAGNWYAILVVGGVGIQVTPAATVFGGQMPGGTTYQYAMTVSVGAPPANDNCANATTLTGASVAGNTLTATNDGSSSCDATGNDVWYTFTAGVNAGTLNLNTCGATIDTAISVYDACGGLELACNDDCGGTPCAGPGSCLSVPVGAGQTVKIRVSDKGLGGGSFTLNWSFTVPPPANDECAGATVISGNGPFAFDNRFATPVASTPGLSCASGTNYSKDVWFAWTSQGAGNVTIDTCTGSGTWDSVVAVYTDCTLATQVACNDDSCGLMSSVTFAVTCNTTYYIRIASWAATTGVTGTFNLSAPGYTDTDGDGTNDCDDGCPLDPNKIAPGICGCGVSDVDTDGDGTADCNDGCPLDPNKIAPGVCGCGVSDVDTDGDGTPDCNDGCPLDPNKTAPGVCGCGVSDVDTDGDGTPDCNDGCPNDPFKVAPGICGCGVSDVDTDGDGTADCNDGCPNDPNKVAAGQCGCGIPDTDTDGDGTADCNDGCPNDPAKTSPGQCGCGVADVDTDGDGVADCIDNCPTTPNLNQLDLDNDGVGDACDNCVQVANPGQGDCNGDLIGDACEIFFGVPDCNANGIPDTCDIAFLTSQDLNNNTIPDECETNGGTPFCFGYTACPCGNNSVAGSGQGCVNSTGLGAALTGSGLSSLGADGLVLSVTNLPVPGSGTGFALFFQGDAQTNVPFNDGRRCVAGAQVRLGVKSHTGGTTTFPQIGDAPISVGGLIGGPGARYYQVWYRNNVGPCGTGSSVSNGLAVIWIP
ncbi:MAG: lamin tail domain-containing protein [Planctomycetes bacterium]|nr:lamin tail domain-containing protein [Planctomycetota bacterium]